MLSTFTQLSGMFYCCSKIDCLLRIQNIDTPKVPQGILHTMIWNVNTSSLNYTHSYTITGYSVTIQMTRNYWLYPKYNSDTWVIKNKYNAQVWLTTFQTDDSSYKLKYSILLHPKVDSIYSKTKSPQHWSNLNLFAFTKSRIQNKLQQNVSEIKVI